MEGRARRVAAGLAEGWMDGWMDGLLHASEQVSEPASVLLLAPHPATVGTAPWQP